MEKKVSDFRKITLPAVILMLFCFASQINAQDKNLVVAIDLTKMNVLYRGVENPAVIMASNTAASDVTATCNNGTIKKSNDLFILSPTKLGACIVTVFVKGAKVGTREFRVKDLPDPVTKAGGLMGGETTKNFLTNVNSLNAELNGSDFEFKFKMTSFVLTVIQNGKTVSKKTEGNLISAEQKALLADLVPGAKVIFENIKVMGPEGSLRDMPSIVFTIK